MAKLLPVFLLALLFASCAGIRSRTNPESGAMANPQVP